MPECTHDRTLNDALVASLGQRDFAPATKFLGARHGAVFKTGARGLGYYRDVHPEADAGVEPRAFWKDAKMCRPVVITLDDLLCVDIEAEERTRRRRRAKRILKRHRGRRAAKSVWNGPHAETTAACALFREAGFWAFDTFNPNCGNKALDYLSATAADACFFQEMKCKAEDLDQQARTAAGQGWRLAGSPAIVTEKGGISSGVAVAVRGHLGLAHPVETSDHAADTPRWCVRWLGSVCRGGLHLISIYLRHSEGLSPANLDILHSVAAAISALKGPWLVAGDFNLEPSLLRQSGWMQLVKGVVHAPAQPTCGLKTYDFFVSSASLAFAVAGVANVVDAGGHPHTPARLYLRAAPRRIMVRSLCKPATFGAMLPAGCLPMPPDYAMIASEQDYMRYSKSVHAREAAACPQYTRAGEMRTETPGASKAAGHDMRAAASIANGPRRSDWLHFSDDGLPWLVMPGFWLLLHEGWGKPENPFLVVQLSAMGGESPRTPEHFCRHARRSC